MKSIFLSATIFVAATLSSAIAADSTNGVVPATDSNLDPAIEKKAGDWVASLNLGDAAKAARVTQAVAEHLQAVRDWHNGHSYTNVPAGINPATGRPLSALDREMIVDSTIPASVHKNLMTALRKDLTEDQVAAILDKYTIGKVAFTMKGYEVIVPDLTADEKTTILKNLSQAREEAIDYKNIKEISSIFEIYKTKNEQFLNSNGRNWHELYKAYVNKIKAEKAAAAEAKKAESK
ncbi:MAG TPA: DUF3826 domain-containing protein [Verrucomicrobiae bacterium]|nr:DUF3826 domain-containing protein [Verrucomicrobiae bacterium]